MKLLAPTLLFLLALTTSAQAQDPFEGVFSSIQNPPVGDSWDAQEPRYDTPKQAVRRKAAWKAAQRRGRLENLKRIGYSPSRPPTSTLPFMGSASGWIVVPAYYPATVIYQRHATASANSGLVR